MAVGRRRIHLQFIIIIYLLLFSILLLLLLLSILFVLLNWLDFLLVIRLMINLNRCFTWFSDDELFNWYSECSYDDIDYRFSEKYEIIANSTFICFIAHHFQIDSSIADWIVNRENGCRKYYKNGSNVRLENEIPSIHE